MDQETRTWAMILHLSVLAGYVIPIPFAGIIAPLLIWQLKKEQLPGLEEHGKEVMNFVISGVIYGFVCALLVLIVMGIPLLIGLLIAGLVLPVIGAVKASNGELYRYPFLIRLV